MEETIVKEFGKCVVIEGKHILIANYNLKNVLISFGLSLPCLFPLNRQLGRAMCLTKQMLI